MKPTFPNTVRKALHHVASHPPHQPQGSGTSVYLLLSSIFSPDPTPSHTYYSLSEVSSHLFISV